MHAQVFRKEDYPTYASWFKNDELNQRLGPIDQEWLDYILADSEGTEFCFFEGNELLCVLGIQWAKPTHPYHVITNIAVNPSHWRKGIAKKVIQLILFQNKDQSIRKWLTYVEKDNASAIKLFLSLEWKEEKEEEGMIPFEKINV